MIIFGYKIEKVVTDKQIKRFIRQQKNLSLTEIYQAVKNKFGFIGMHSFVSLYREVK